MHEDAIARLRELMAKADAQDVWMLATSNSWKRVLTIFGKPVITPCVDHDGHPNMDKLENIELAIAAVNALPALLALADAVKWQPIETAPKDAPAWLVWSDAFKRPIVVEHRMDNNTFWEGDWDYDVQATHWMPLPAAPSLVALPEGE